jgi:membrane protein YqaA with SNARE-associated domain
LDALVVVLAARFDELFWIVPPLVTMVSLAGATLSYWIGHTAGYAGLPRLVPPHHLERMKARLDTMGASALAAAALMPPPFPLTAFLMTCGALDFDRRRFVLVFGVVRMIRFSAVALLARQYGGAVLQILEPDRLYTPVTAFTLLAVTAAIGVSIVLVWRTRPQPA